VAALFSRARFGVSRVKRHPLRLLAGIATLLLVAGGAVAGFVYLGPGQSSPKQTSPAGATRAESTTFIEGDVGAPSTLNPLLASSSSEQDLVPLLFSGLVRVDGSGSPQPELAVSWPVSSDGLSYTVKLRDGARWQDGQPITAADVLFTIRLIQSPDFNANPALSDFWRGINVTTEGRDSLTFHLIRPFAPFPTYLTFPVLPKHILGDVVAGDLATDPFSSAPIGSGPFRFVSWNREDGVIELTRNDRYFGQQARLSGLTIRYYQSTGALLSALKAGAIDGTGSLSTSDLIRPHALPSGYKIYSSPLLGYTALFFNTQAAPLNQVDVRRAIGLAIDKAAVVRNALSGQGSAGTGPVPVSSWAYTSPSASAYDQAGAVTLLEKSGWRQVNGKLVKDGSQLSLPIIVNSDDPLRVAAAEEVARQLGAIGISVSLSAMTSADLSRVLASGQFTAAIFGWRSTTGDPDSYDLWSSAGLAGGQNFTGLHDSGIDQVLGAARTTAGEAQRKRLYLEFQQSFADDSPASILYHPRYLFVVSDRVAGVQSLPVVNAADRFDQITSWHFDASQATPDH